MATTAPPRAPRGTSNGRAPTPAATLQLIPVAQIIVGDNVRTAVGDVDELAASIAAVGILQPLTVEPGGDGVYLLKIGHRRLAASKQAGLTHVPAIVDATPALGPNRAIQQLVENVQRRDLNALEEAKALRGILDASKGMTQDQLAEKVGRSRPAVTNLLRILDLNPKVQELAASGELTAAHAKALAGVANKKEQLRLASEAIQRGSSAHQLERDIAFARERAERATKEVDDLAAWAEKTEVALIQKGADKKTSTLTTWDDYSGETAPIRALKARGWKFAEKSYSRGKTCDCSAFAVSKGYYGDDTSIRQRCTVRAHAEVMQKERHAASVKKTKQADAARDRERDQRTRLAGPIEERVADDLADTEPGTLRFVLLALGTAHWSLGSDLGGRLGVRIDPYQPAGAWEAIAGVPDTQLPGLIATLVARQSLERTNVGMREALGQVLGIIVTAEAQEASPAKPKAKKAAKA